MCLGCRAYVLGSLSRYESPVIGCQLQPSLDPRLLQRLLEGRDHPAGQRPQCSIQEGCALPFQQPQLADLMAEGDMDLLATCAFQKGL